MPWQHSSTSIPTAPIRCLSGVADLHGVLDRTARRSCQPLVEASTALVVAEVDRAIRRIEALKLKVVAAADSGRVAKDAGFTGADAWLAKTTTVSRSDAARQVAPRCRPGLRS